MRETKSTLSLSGRNTCIAYAIETERHECPHPQLGPSYLALLSEMSEVCTEAPVVNGMDRMLSEIAGILLRSQCYKYSISPRDIWRNASYTLACVVPPSSPTPNLTSPS